MVLATALAWACTDEPTAPPRVSYVRVSPSDTLISPGDTVRFGAVAFGLDGEPLDVALAWHVDDRGVGLVDSLGAFIATREGQATVVASEVGGVRGLAGVDVGPVSGIHPGHSAFGGIVTLEGAGFGPASRVAFGARQGITRSVSADGRTLTAWVPWDAENGRLSVHLADGREVEAPAPFFLTGGGDDALEPNGLERPTPLEVPFRNPYLATRLTSMDTYRLTLLEPTALTVRVGDRETVNDWQRRLVLQMSREGGVGEFVGVTPAWAFARNERQDGVIARTTVGPGNFRLFVFIGPSTLAVDRRYELTIDTKADFVLPPDPSEPDDAPFEAPVFDSGVEGRFTLENPWATAYYALDVDTRSRVFVEAVVPGSAGVFLIDGEESVTWQLSNGVRSGTYRGVIAPFGQHAFDCTVDPGRYYVGVLENSGNAGQYDLRVRVEPTTSSFLNCRTPGFGGGRTDALNARGVPGLP